MPGIDGMSLPRRPARPARAPLAAALAASLCAGAAACAGSAGSAADPGPAADSSPPAAPADAPADASPPASPPAPGAVVGAHLEGAWIPARAARLSLDPAVAAERDAAFAAGPPEDGLWWDEQLAREVHTLWHDLCADCHGGSRSLAKVLSRPPPARGWAERDALFFARLRAPRSVFRAIAEGVKSTRADVKDMPGWRDRVSNEQMWGLVYFIKTASKKKGGDLR